VKLFLKHITLTILTTVVVFITNHNSSAQTYNFDHYNVAQGLPQSKVNCILQDSRGYLWIGTAGGGICKFDGLNFTVYEEKDGIAGDIITDITEDIDGNIWFTSTWGGITKYNGRNFNIFTAKEDNILHSGYRTIFSDNKGVVWIGSGLGLTTFSDGYFKNFTKEKDGLLSSRINSITQDSKNNILIGTDEGIMIFGGNDTINITTEDGLPAKTITSIIEDVNGNYLIGSKEQGIVKLLKGSIDNNKQFEFEKVNLPNNTFNARSILIDNEKTTWITTEKNGIYTINRNKEINHISKKNGLSTNSTTDIFQDRSGNLWIGTDGGGIIKYSSKAFTYFNKIEGLNSGAIFSILEDDNNNIWVSTSDNGIYKYNGTTSTNYNNTNQLPNNNVRTSVKDKNGNLWFGTENGLVKYNNGIFKTFTTSNGLPSNNIRVLHIDKSNILWIGTFGGGLSKYENSTFTNYSFGNDEAQNYVHSLYKDSKDNLWIGTGLGIKKMSKGIITAYPNSNICNPYIGSITEDKNGNIWFGTDQCVIKYNGIDFKSITQEDGLSSNIIYLLHINRNNKLWIGTNKGLDKVSFNSYGQIQSIKNYNIAEGFKGVECNSRSIFEDKKGNLWIGSVNGLIKYNPREDKTNVFEPIIHINKVKLFFEEVSWLNFAKRTTKWDDLPVNLVLEHTQNHLTFEFSGISMTYPEYVKYSYKIENFDKDWSPSTNKTSATYSNLPPGKYVFKVSARNNDGVWSHKSAEFPFEIKAPFWETIWFILILLTLLFYAIYKISTYKEKRQLEISRELERKVRERTHLIEEQRNEKEVLLKEIHHRVKNNLQVINSLLSIQSSYTDDAKALALFDEAKNRIRSMALIHEKMYQTDDLSRIDFQDYILALTDDLISTYSINCDIFLDIDITETQFDIDTIIPIGLLMNEVISNTLKYAFVNTDKGKLTIHLDQDYKTKQYTLIIGDNGVGLSQEKFEEEEGTSLGMELIKIFISQIDGRIELLDKKGTYFKIQFYPRIK